MRRAIWIAILVVLFSSCGKPSLKETLKSRQSQSKPAQTQETPKDKTKSGLVIYETKVENIEQAVRKTLYDLNDNVYLIKMEYVKTGIIIGGLEVEDSPVYYLFDFSGFVGKIKCQWNGQFKKYENIFVADKKYFFTFKTEENASKKLVCVKADLETGKTRFIEPDAIPKNASKLEPKYLGMNQESATNAHIKFSQYSGDEIERRTGIKQPDKTNCDYCPGFIYAFDSNGYIFVVEGIGTDAGAYWGVACHYLGVFKEKTWKKVFESKLGNEFWLFESMMIFQSWSEGANSSNFVDLATGKVIPGYSDIDVITPIDRKLFMFATENGVRKLVALNIDKLDELRNQ